jgi:DNA-binding SARP family transcriptional activator
MWTLQVLGPVRLLGRAGAVPLGRKGEAVLGWLATRPNGSGPRRALVDLLWADRSESDARNSLRQWLFQFRRAHGADAPLATEGDRVLLAAGCEVDLHRFVQLAQAPSPAGWLEACGLWRGDFAEGPSVSPAFDAWRANQSEMLRDAAAALLDRMAQAPCDAPALEAATALARSLLAIEPLHEGCWRALMQLQARAGLHARAMATWAECRRALRSGAGIEPGPETQATYRRVRQQARVGVVRGHAHPAPLHPDDAQAQAADHAVRSLHHFFNGSPRDNVLAREAMAAASALQPHRCDYAVQGAWTWFTDFNFVWNGAPMANYLRAAAEARKLLQRFAGDPWPIAFDAKLKLWRGEFGAAVDGFAQAVTMAPESHALWANAADALARSGCHDEALAYAHRAIELEPMARGFPQFVAGLAHFGLGELDEALGAFESALRRNPGFCPALGGIAAVLSEQGRRGAAQDAAFRSFIFDSGQLTPVASQSLGPFAQAAMRQRWLKAWTAARP